jgi:hypothetical protein
MSVDAMRPAVTPCYAFAAHVGSGELQLNIPLNATEAGTPVFDAQGRLMGLADPPTGGGAGGAGKAGVKRMTPAGNFVKSAPVPGRGGAAYSNQPTIAMPELYEQLAPTVVQVVVFSAAPL